MEPQPIDLEHWFFPDSSRILPHENRVKLTPHLSKDAFCTLFFLTSQPVTATNATSDGEICRPR